MLGQRQPDFTASTRRPRVLVVDDHAVFRAAARELLEHRGFSVVGEADGASTGLEAVEAVDPDVVVLDVHLPDGDGVEVCRTLTDADPALVVLLVSADGDPGPGASACGAVGFLPKARLGSADLRALLCGGAADGIVPTPP